MSIVCGAFSCITLVSLPVEIDPNLGDHMRTRNAENANENGPKKTSPNSRKQLRQDCKIFIHRFDSDRRLQNLNIFNRGLARSLDAAFRLSHGWGTRPRLSLEGTFRSPDLRSVEFLA